MLPFAPERFDLTTGDAAHLQGEIFEQDDAVAVGKHVGVGNRIGLGCIADLFDFHFIANTVGLGRHFSTLSAPSTGS